MPLPLAPMKTFAIALALVPGLPLAQATAVAAPTARDLHSARCVAALDVQTRDLARGVKAGDASLRGVLEERLLYGAAFVGDAYLNGASDEQQAKALRDQAIEAQKSLPPPQLAGLRAACASEGAKLYESANALQQAVVKRLAKKRLDRLLGG
jgi:hypothetical protein